MSVHAHAQVPCGMRVHALPHPHQLGRHASLDYPAPLQASVLLLHRSVPNYFSSCMQFNYVQQLSLLRIAAAGSHETELSH
jgi:hypothetical protein